MLIMQYTSLPGVLDVAKMSAVKGQRHLREQEEQNLLLFCGDLRVNMVCMDLIDRTRDNKRVLIICQLTFNFFVNQRKFHCIL